LYINFKDIKSMKKLLFKLTFLVIAICITTAAEAQTAGTLTCVFTPTTPTGSTFYQSPRHALSAWIQTSAGTFVKTKLHYCCGGSTSDHVPTWSSKSGGNTTDASTGATKSSYSALTFTWSGTNVAGAVVADGAYNIVVEDCWNHGTTGITTYTFSFTKGTTSSTVNPTPTTHFTGASVVWHPAVTTGIDEAASVNPTMNVYPNPTEGIFSVEFQNATSIKVINALGVIVYDEKIEQLTEGTKNIDLTNFSNGVYFINVSNGINSSNHKVLLNK
jgi:hypothetical protein